MNNDNFEFWKIAFDMKAIDITLLRQAVITEKNPYGDLTKEQFKEISQEDFENIPSDN